MIGTAEAPDHSINHLLVVAADHATINRLISSLRNEGMALRAASANSSKEVDTLLTQQQWDVLVVYDTASVALEELLLLLRKHQQDIPVIQVTAQPTPDEIRPALFNQGVNVVVQANQTGKLVVSIMREASHYQLRKQLRWLEIRLQELDRRHERLLEDSPAAISYVRDGMHLYCNPGYAALFGYDSTTSIRSTPLLNLVVPAQRAALKELLAKAETGAHSGSFMARLFDGSETELHFGFNPVEYQGKPCLQMTAQPAAGNAEYSEELARLNTMDLLTTLDNRTHFITRIEDAIRNAVQKSMFSALLLVEVDDFAAIEAALGRSSSNLVLNDIADFLQQAVTLPFAAGRLDDHVFGILLFDGNPDAALALCQNIRENITNRISSAMVSSLELSCSVGMALINGHALNAGDILERARLNQKQKLTASSGSSQFRIGDSLLHDANDMVEYLKTALVQRRFKPVFQPIVGISGNNQRFYEMLIRMLDKDGNEIMPGAFLPLANINGLGEQVDRLVISMALETLQASDEVQQLAVNITDNTLLSHTFLPWLSEQLRTSRIQAERLLIDLSEIAVHAQYESAREFCAGLEVLGVKLTISHFGCALNAFALLDTLHPEYVTLDETVVRDLVYSSHQKTHVQGLVKALHARNLQVVTPRVEEMAVLPVLWEIGVDFVQGYSVQAPSHEMNYEFVQDEEITLTALPQ